MICGIGVFFVGGGTCARPSFVKGGADTDALYLLAEMNFYPHFPQFLTYLYEIRFRMFPRISVEKLRGCEKRVF